MGSNGRATVQDVYNIVNRLEDKMDARLCALEKCVDENTSFRYRIIGMASLAGAIAGSLASALWEKLTK